MLQPCFLIAGAKLRKNIELPNFFWDFFEKNIKKVHFMGKIHGKCVTLGGFFIDNN